MKKILILIVSATFFSCSYKAFPKFDFNNGPNPFINAFKDNVFFECLRESYNNEQICDLVAKRDALNPYDDLSLENRTYAKKLAKEFVQKIPPPSLCDDCKPGVNYYMAQALHYYRSRELDSIARKEYKKYLQEEKKSELHK